MLWDLFCRVIDNYGDIGVCWRLARALAGEGDRVRLWVDDATALRWMAPDGAVGVEVHAFAEDGLSEPGDVVIEAFGCDPPPGFVARMARRTPRPVWVNLEYLSAEDYVERSHGLRSPQFAGPGAGLDKWFFYPGFGPRTGGLLGGAAHVDGASWLHSRGWAPQPGERVVLLFCYDNPALPALLADLGQEPTLLLAAPGAAQAGIAALGTTPGLRSIALPWLPQPEFDQLLCCTDLNFVRGEDSFVQAGWAARPFVWQLYPQHDGAHAAKLDAFVDRFVATTGLADGAALRALWRAWNGLGPWPACWPDAVGWRAACAAWRDGLLAEDGLMTRLKRFVEARR